MRILGLDYGSVTIGVAVTDPLMMTAQCLTTIKRKSENKLRQTFAALEAIIDEYHIEKIVLGFPVNMNDTLGERALKTLEFRDRLTKRVGLPVIMWNERLTTARAQEILDETGFKKDRASRKQIIDQLAAQLILQNYMDYISGGGKDEDLP